MFKVPVFVSFKLANAVASSTRQNIAQCWHRNSPGTSFSVVASVVAFFKRVHSICRRNIDVLLLLTVFGSAPGDFTQYRCFNQISGAIQPAHFPFFLKIWPDIRKGLFFWTVGALCSHLIVSFWPTNEDCCCLCCG